MVQLHVKMDAWVFLQIAQAQLPYFERRIRLIQEVTDPPLKTNEILRPIETSIESDWYKIKFIHFMQAFGGIDADMDRLRLLLSDGIDIENPVKLRSVVVPSG